MSLARAKSRHTLQTCYRGYQAFEAAQKEREKTNVWVKLHHIALLCGVLSSRQEGRLDGEDGNTGGLESLVQGS